MLTFLGNFFFRYRNGLFPFLYAFLVLNNQPIFDDYRVGACLGLLLSLSGQILRAIACGFEYIFRGGRSGEVYAETLVTGGMFAQCRNPLYIGNFLILVGVGLASNSRLFMAIAIPCFAFAYWAIITAEENYLHEKFGQEFEHYCARVNRILPRVWGLRQTFAGSRFNWGQLISVEHGSTFLWVAAIILVTLKNVWLADKAEHRHSQVLVTNLWVALGLVTLAYILVRLAKKNGGLCPIMVRNETGRSSSLTEPLSLRENQY